MRMPPRAATPGVVVILLLLLAMTAWRPTALANPAQQGVTRTVMQPDGTSLELELWGDEYANGWQTSEGHTVRFDSGSGYWVYATRDADGALVESSSRAGIDAPIEAPRLRPSQVWLNQQYRLFGDGTAPGEISFKKAAPSWASGATNILMILVEFPADAGDPDGSQPAVSNTFSAAQLENNFFGGTASGPGDMNDYYLEVSFGNLDLTGDVVGPYTVANDKNDYDDGPLSHGNLVQEAVALADPDVDFSDYDLDGDGNVDMVALIYAGGGPDNSVYEGADPDVNRLWPRSTSLGAAVALDGKNFTSYFISPELTSGGVIRTIGVYCHEFGHKLGIPDFYDTDDSSEGVGHWCLMGSGSWTGPNGNSPAHMSAYPKSFLGWISVTDRTGMNVAEAVPDAAANPFAIRLGSNPGGIEIGGSGEYFLIENRQFTGFDAALDGCGLLVWHIDESLTSNADEGHTAGSHRLIDLEEADNDFDLDTKTNRGDTGDPFPGSDNNSEWADDTAPHSQLYDGTSTDYRMKVLSTGCETNMDITLNNQPPTAVCQDVELNADEVNCVVDVSPDMVDNGSSDPDGDPLTLSLSPPGPYGLGVTNVVLTVTDDKGESDTCSATITVIDVTAPVVHCPENIVVECSVTGGVPVDDPQLAQFFEDFMVEDNCDSDPMVTDDAPDLFPGPCDEVTGGVTTVTWTATDDSGNMNQCSAIVTVVDTTAPEFDTLEPSRDVLWPPNHKMSDISVEIEVSDTCDDDPQVTLLSVTSSEPDNGNGDGNTVNDIQGVEAGTDDREFSLRSERSGGNKDGRVYTISYRVEDCSGNFTDAEIYVRVPHNQSAQAMSFSGFNSAGTGLDPAALVARVVVPTVPQSIKGGGPSVGESDELVVFRFDARKILREKVRIGNSGLVAKPIEARLHDINGDGHYDLVLAFDVRQVLEISETADEFGVAGLQFRTALLSEDYLIKDIFALGAPLQAPLPAENPEVVVEGDQLSIAPNPFNPRTTFKFRLDGSERVSLMVYNLRGQLVDTLVDTRLDAGVHQYVWNGTDGSGRAVASGFYLVRFNRASGTTIHKVTLLK